MDANECKTVIWAARECWGKSIDEILRNLIKLRKASPKIHKVSLERVESGEVGLGDQDCDICYLVRVPNDAIL